MTADEFVTMDLLAASFNAFCNLPVCHPSEIEEFTRAIHAAQHIVMAREAVRVYPDRFRHAENFMVGEINI